ncbi:MAG: aminopeptidase [Erysipelotrichaceae bacterium]|nr:aminopeptidase [Erysipelotrichaceae bacterium]
MIKEELKKKYAYTLARVGLNVQPGQTILVEAAIEGRDFVPYFAEECYKLGAGNVVVHYLDLPTMKVSAAYRKAEDVRNVENWEQLQCQKYLDEGACYIRLEGVNPKLMEDCPEEEANAIFAHVDAVRNIMRKASREKHCQWCIAMIPTREWADYILPDIKEEDRYDELWKLILKLCYITEDNDIVAVWEEKNRLKLERGNLIDSYNFTKFHYTAFNGTDLTVELTPDSKFGYRPRGDQNFIRFNANIPTEEICTTPEKFGTNGVVYASRPLVLGGKSVEKFGFRFENGKVVEVIANEGKEMLEALVKMDENAGYLGEAALVEYHSPISMSGRVFYTTLIDENASCHLALGRGLSGAQPKDSKYTFNDSVIHIDFMIGTSDMHIVGTTADGKEVVIFDQGDFAI